MCGAYTRAMGLAVTAGMLAAIVPLDSEGADYYRAVFARIDKLLAAQKINAKGYREPEEFTRPKMRRYLASFPYEYMRLLTRAMARHIEGVPVVPVGADTRDDRSIFADASSLLSSHLLLVCTTPQGVFVPVELGDPLFLEDGSGIPGSFLGSSLALVRELTKLAVPLGITLEGAALSDAEAARVYSDEAHALSRERHAWLSLWECARVSTTCTVSLVLH